MNAAAGVRSAAGLRQRLKDLLAGRMIAGRQKLARLDHHEHERPMRPLRPALLEMNRSEERLLRCQRGCRFASGEIGKAGLNAGFRA